ncbi:hypothetical protein PBRA_002252 [Plasmodiophora brassicae]|uniref:Uncharacterized protein n=1 Tax=Plasmodiophora brassicae TaxID=37360 RepID=A0A0G4J383_PLABS|nr:hypothetical protein PBRA_002252 [Plasmodiophora brassicae]
MFDKGSGVFDQIVISTLNGVLNRFQSAGLIALTSPKRKRRPVSVRSSVSQIANEERGHPLMRLPVACVSAVIWSCAMAKSRWDTFDVTFLPGDVTTDWVRHPRLQRVVPSEVSTYNPRSVTCIHHAGQGFFYEQWSCWDFEMPNGLAFDRSLTRVTCSAPLSDSVDTSSCRLEYSIRRTVKLDEIAVGVLVALALIALAVSVHERLRRSGISFSKLISTDVHHRLVRSIH